MKYRITLTVLFFLLAVLFYVVGQSSVSDVATSEIAVSQTNGGAAEYVAAHEANPNNLLNLYLCFAAPLVVIMWCYSILKSNIKRKNSFIPVGAFVALAVLIVGCRGPAEVDEYVEIDTSETAFVISLSDANTQDQLQSVEFLRENQVSVKRIKISHVKKSTGRYSWNYEWISGIRVVVVDRSPVSREWTHNEETGSTPSNQAFTVESAESIDFQIGATCTAMITEEDAALYLYHFPGKPLEEVMDENIRSFVQAQLFEKFGKLTLEEARTQKSDVFSTVRAEAVSHFAEMGITITSLGGSDGMVYSDPKVQDQINQNFAAQQEEERSRARATAQSIDNERILEEAYVYATSTVVAGNATNAVYEELARILQENPDLVDWEIARKMNGDVPEFLVVGESEGLPFSFFIDTEENDELD
jgi:molybdopterin-biosynthesis enzyme MoeA-like protein